MDETKNYTHLPDIPRLQESGNQNFLTAISNTNHLLGHEIYHPPSSHNKKLTSSHTTSLQQSSSSTSVLDNPSESPNDNHRETWYNQSDETNLLIYGSNTSKLLENHADNYLSSRYNVKGIRNERTSFFDIPAATHPYCYRFASSPSVLKKETEDGLTADKVFPSHSSSIHLSHHLHHHHHHIQYPDSTTNLNPQQITQGPANNSQADSHYPYHSAYTLRSIDSAIVSSSEPDITFGGLYANNSNITNSNSLNQRRGSLQLWQFLVALLDEPSTSSGCIAWTGRGMEFKLIEPEEVARRWGLQKNRPAMNYDKLSRSLRYYYEKGIMQKVAGERYVYKFVCDPEALFNMAYGGGGGGGHNNSNSTDTTNYNTSNCKTSTNIQNTLGQTVSEIESEKSNPSGFYSTNSFQNSLK